MTPFSTSDTSRYAKMRKESHKFLFLSHFPSWSVIFFTIVNAYSPPWQRFLRFQEGYLQRFEEFLVILSSIARKTTFKSLSRLQILINTAAAATRVVGRCLSFEDGPNYAWNSPQGKKKGHGTSGPLSRDEFTEVPFAMLDLCALAPVRNWLLPARLLICRSARSCTRMHRHNRYRSSEYEATILTDVYDLS